MRYKFLLAMMTLMLVLFAAPLGYAVAEEEPQPAAETCEGCTTEETVDQNATMAPVFPLDSNGIDGNAVDGATPECDPVEDLELICSYEEDGQPGTFWQNGMEDFNAGLLTVNYRLDNTGPAPLLNVRVTEATATNEVKIATELPLMLGTIEPGSYLTFLLQWQLPENGVAGFQTDIEICADCPTEEEIIEEPEPEVEPSAEPERREPATVAAVLPATGFGLLGAAVLAIGAGAALMCIGGRGRTSDIK